MKVVNAKCIAPKVGNAMSTTGYDARILANATLTASQNPTPIEPLYPAADRHRLPTQSELILEQWE
ncbi:hypothetical protein [Nostoc favosum]|uniref:Uncharacterized protein n=1 Tax=Nostoc favosum CHAB5714 TaxID=2780399 RepID=A0ABS8I9P0_9NOSO|nr:hypothetical protein [Nostoc favosum]MCC5600499.1 hypothetical protein [Nostoc favosum CHAB5714]